MSVNQSISPIQSICHVWGLIRTLLICLLTAGCASLSGPATDALWPSADASPSGLSVAGRWHLGPVYDAVAADDTAYFSLGGAIRVLQQDPLTRRWRRSAQIDGYGVLRDLVLVGNTLFAADNTGLLVTFDVTDPAAIAESGRVKLPAAVTSLSVSGPTAVLSAGWAGVVLVDVTDPTAPQLLGVKRARGYVQDAFLEGGVALLANAYRDNGLSLIDLRDPSAPAELGHHSLPGIAFGVHRDGERAYIVNLEAYEGEGAGLTIFDISDPTQPGQLGHHPVTYGAERVRVRDDVAYLAGVANDAGLIVVDVADPTAPRRLGSYGSPTCSEAVELSGALAFLAHGDEGLEIIDIARPRRPTVINHHDAAGKARAVERHGDYLYVANGYGGLRVLKPDATGGLHEIAHTPTYRAMDVAVSDGYAFLAEDAAGLRVIDVSQPERPQQIARIDTPGDAYGVTVADGHAYVADGPNGLRILDVRNPAQPSFAGRFETAGYARAVAVADRLAYIADGKGGLRIVDVTDAGGAKALGLFRHAEADVWDVTVIDEVAYLAAGAAGLLAVDVANPRDPRLLAQFDTPQTARSVAVADGVAYVGGYARVLAVDVRQRGSLIELSRLAVPGITDKLDAAPGLVFVAGYDAGVSVLRFTPPALGTAGAD